MLSREEKQNASPVSKASLALLVLAEAKVLSVLAEALTADVELVLADEGLLVAADDTAAAALAHADLLAGTPLVEMAHGVGEVRVVLGAKKTGSGKERSNT